MAPKFKRQHATYVLVTFSPDSGNEFTVDGDVHVVNIDLGSSFTNSPNDEEQAVDWAENLPGWLNPVPITSPVYTATLKLVADVVSDYPKAVAVVNAYKVKRES